MKSLLQMFKQVTTIYKFIRILCAMQKVSLKMKTCNGLAVSDVMRIFIVITPFFDIPLKQMLAHMSKNVFTLYLRV